MFTEEVWKIIKDFPDYMISNIGRIKSLKFGKEKILKLKKHNNKGYLGIRLFKNGYKSNKYIHVLVLENFIGKKDGFQVNHINGIKTDNRLENLEWVTPSENRKHAFNIGLDSNKGENHPMFGKHHSRKTKCKISKKLKKYYQDNIKN